MGRFADQVTVHHLDDRLLAGFNCE